MKKLLVLTLALWALPYLTTDLRAEALGVGIVLDLLDAGISEQSIRRYVERNGFYFDLGADDLIILKQRGASDELILFLQECDSRQEAEPEEVARAKGERETISDEVHEGNYAVGYYAPGYSYGVYFSYPLYYGGYYYYGYYPDYYAYYPYGNYYYGHPYQYYRGHHRGTGVYSYWYRGRASHGGSRVRRGSTPHRSVGSIPRSSGRSSRPGGRGRR